MFPQLLVNSIILSSKLIIFGISFNLIYEVIGFFHFAHAIVFTFGAYFTFLFSIWCGFPIYIAFILAIICSSILGGIMEVGIYSPLRARNASPLVNLLASMGIYVALQNIISIIFGDNTKSVRTWEIKEGLEFIGARISIIQIIIIITSILIIISILVFLRKSKLGKAMKAISDDPQLSELSGINTGNIILWTFFLGSSLAGLAGALVSLDINMNPTMGMNELMVAVIVVIIGGVGSILGVIYGALLLGFSMNFGVWKIGTQWQDTIAFLILLFFLLIRPEGFFGKKSRSVRI